MSSPYYLPAAQGPFVTWGTNFGSLITATPTAYGLVAGDATAFNTAFGDFTTAYAISTTPATRTPVTVADTQTEFNNARAVAQSLVQKAQASGLIDATKAADLGITFRDTTKTPIAPPTATPELAMQQISPQAAKLRIKELGALNNRIPVGSVGYQVAVKIDPPTPPTSPSELTLIGVGTRRFYDLSFAPGDIGKTVYIAIRYVNAKQQVGPWSNMLTSTVVGA